jgi:hypothetical protein
MAAKIKRKAPKTQAPRGTRERKEGGQVVVLTAYLPPELAQRARIRAVSEGRTVSAVVAHALQDLLGAA